MVFPGHLRSQVQRGWLAPVQPLTSAAVVRSLNTTAPSDAAEKQSVGAPQGEGVLTREGYSPFKVSKMINEEDQQTSRFLFSEKFQ